jgi:hypothetical protein
VYGIPVGAYEQREAAIGCAAVVKIDRSHAPRGNGIVDAPRPVFDAERRGLHDHAERGYDQQVRVYAIPVGAYEQREAAIGCAAVVKRLGSLADRGRCASAAQAWERGLSRDLARSGSET